MYVYKPSLFAVARARANSLEYKVLFSKFMIVNKF